MEVVFYGALTTLWWCFHVCPPPIPPPLEIQQVFRDRWFSFIFVRILGPIFSPINLPLRKRTFSILGKHLEGRDMSKELEVLEIGIGGGANLPVYPENSRLTAVDMNESFKKYFSDNQRSIRMLSTRGLF
ncbi:hypothetical protein JTE90_029360 [Oedothorax gibbosus]|uniref:Methyltransferase-like protein 7A n=1 Tax=Oedothorax gibbosus TaxID=931172 RepID=A0AAV6TK38_9ARAC|nr:hypothetical protein JTE90_029360 [Oedothorax gibbosus]